MTLLFARRVLMAIPTLLGISMVVFAIVTLAPGDPFAQLADNPAVPSEVRLQLRAELGLDEPLPVQYVRWLGTIAHGQLGYSFTSRIDVKTLILERLPTTLFITTSAYVLAIVLALTIGTLASVRKHSWFDNIATVVSYAGFSLPTFLTALLLIFVFSVNLGLLPMIYSTSVEGQGIDWAFAMLRQAAMPVLVLALFEGATLTRYVRTSMLNVLSMDYVRTARAKGLAEWMTIVRHALRNGLIPVVTIAAIQLPGLFTGSIVVEQIFSVPGIGSLLLGSYYTKDVPVLMAIVLGYSVLVVTFTLIADLAYAALDPRVRIT
jgi:peptide/nickel transport system permease protein